jgi:NADH-quinone oxidoreductase subunit L
MSDEQDMRRMGGLWRLIPWTYGLMWIGSLALAGIWPFAGYFSKDVILEAAWGAHSGAGTYAFILGVASAFMTAFYSWRLLFMTFHGKSRADHHTLEHAHESPWVMLAPLVVLAAGAVVAGWIAYDWFVGEGREAFWRESLLVMAAHDSLEAAHHAPVWVKFLPLVMGVGGIALAYLMYIAVPALPAMLATALQPLYLFLLNKWYFDELYDFLFVRPAVRLGRLLWLGGDAGIIDRFGPDGIAAASIRLARRASALQTGYVYHYAFAMLIGVVMLITWYLFLQAG